MPGEGELLSIQPNDVKLPFELKKQISCTLRLVNTTEQDVAYKVKTTAPRNYFVRPNSGLLSPEGSAEVLITMQALQEAPAGMQCRDKFLVQSVIAPVGITEKDLPHELFDKSQGKSVREARLRVVFVAPPPATSPAAESAEEFEFLSPRLFSTVDGRSRHYMAPDAATAKEISELQAKLSEARAEHAEMSAERNSAVERYHRLQQELKIMVAQSDGRNPSGGISKGNSQALKPRQPQAFTILLVLIIGALGTLVGFIASRQGVK